MNNCECQCHKTGFKFKKAEPLIPGSMYTTYLTVDCCQCGSLESLTNFLKKIASITQPTKRTAIQIIEEAKQILNEIKS